jgi:hypothetical protein
MARAQFVNLADRAADGVLVALCARLRVVDRAEAVGDEVARLEGLAVCVVLRLVYEVVRVVVKGGRSLCRFGVAAGRVALRDFRVHGAQLLV